VGHFRQVVLVGASCLLLVGASASAGTKFQPYPDRKAADCSTKSDKDGLIVGAEPMENLKDQKTYFGTNLTEKGYLPIFLVVENNSSEDSYLFDKSNVALAAASSGAVKEARSKKGEVFAMFGIGGIFTMNAITKATEVQQNLLKREIQSKTLSLGKSVTGFLYVPVPKEGGRAGINLQIPLVNARTSEVRMMNLTL
jgi:hypothetical protein